jgi:MFS family permease
MLFIGLRLGSFSAMSLTVAAMIMFFFASAGASAAYLTASEVFPMETRALCIAFFYAIGTAAGGISGPYYFGKLLDKADTISDIATGYYVGAALMIAGGVVAIFLGVHAEGESLENIATPLTAEDAPSEGRGQPEPASA